ncbi:hypothetical protein [Cohnella sp. 56]|uniref:hypothetical protein n=1 Tax=Cohnella sp. 56 TaxID=3113722 RepID=UPI0030E877D4
MDKLFEQLLELTEEAAAHLEQMTDEDWQTFMARRTDLMIQIRREDAELDEDAPIRLQLRLIADRLARLDRQIVAHMTSLRDEASRQLRSIKDGRKQKQVYEQEELMEEGYFVDKRR